MNERRQERWIKRIENELVAIRAKRICIEQAAHILFYQIVAEVIEEEKMMRENLELINGGKGH